MADSGKTHDIPGKDIEALRELARRYLEVCSDPIQAERRELWRDHNSLIEQRPPIYVRAIVADEVPEIRELACESPWARQYEHWFRHRLYWASLGDDTPFEPWITVGASHRCTGWGLAGDRAHSDTPGGSWKLDYPIKALSDIDKLRAPWHEIDEAATAERVGRLSDALGDILTVDVDRGPAYRMWSGDISTDEAWQKLSALATENGWTEIDVPEGGEEPAAGAPDEQDGAYAAGNELMMLRSNLALQVGNEALSGEEAFNQLSDTLESLGLAEAEGNEGTVIQAASWGAIKGMFSR